MKKEDCILLLRKLLLIRKFEQLVAKLFEQEEYLTKIQGTAHLSIGQEAIPVGVCYNLTKADVVTASHRPHHIMLAKGLDVKRLLAEMFGKEKGFCKGRASAMHLFSRKDNFFGANDIVGANIAISAGIALALKRKKSKAIVVTFFGDGATTEGIFHETANMASLMQLPIIFACENNLYAQSTALAEHSAITNLANKVEAAYGIKSMQLDGNDLIKIITASKKIINFVRTYRQPYFVEFLTYRLCGHSIHDTEQAYRTVKEVEKWSKKDPILKFKHYLFNKRFLTEEQFKRIENEINQELKAALVFAQ